MSDGLRSVQMPTNAPTLDIVPLTPDRFADLAALFEEGGDPKWRRYQSQIWASR